MKKDPEAGKHRGLVINIANPRHQPMSDTNIAPPSDEVNALSVIKPTRIWRPQQDAFGLCTQDEEGLRLAVVNDVDPTVRDDMIVHPYHVREIRYLVVQAPLLRLLNTDEKPTLVLRHPHEPEVGYGLWSVSEPVYDEWFAKTIAAKVDGVAEAPWAYIPLGEVIRYNPEVHYRITTPPPIRVNDLHRVEVNLEELVAKFPRVRPEIWQGVVNGEDAGKLGDNHNDRSASGTAFYVAKALLGAGVDASTVYSILLNSEWKVGANVQRQRDLRAKPSAT